MKNVIKLTHPKTDVLSIVLSSLGFGGLLVGFSSAGEDGWTSAKVLISLIAGSVILALFQGLTQQEAKIQIAHQAQLSGYNASFLFATLVATAGVIISLFLKNKSASK